MSETVSFKAYLKRDGEDVEVRRFGVDGGAATNFVYLRNKIQAMFPSIQNDQFNVFWQDNDKDYVAIGSDEELIEALTAPGAYPFKLFINVTSQQQQQNNKGGSGQPQAHPGIVCDSCDQPVVGFRYKCVTCSDFDLCAACEAACKHPEHFMLRMPDSFGSSSCHPKFFRKFFGRPHKFHKFARHCSQGAGFAGAGARGCPFSRREGSAPAPAAGDMFDFSALLEFINSLSSPSAQEPQANAPTASEPAANAQASSNSQSTPQPSGVNYLNSIGQAITAILDPFGVDVTFDVRTPSSRTAETPAPPQSTPTTESPHAPSNASAPTSTQINAPSNGSAPTSTQMNAPSSVSAPTSTQMNAPSSVSAPTSSQMNAPSNSSAPTSTQLNAPSSSQQSAPIVSPPQNIYPAVPVLEKQTTQVKDTTPFTARRNSDDWTLINRESPTRTESAMDVDEARAGASSAEAPKATTSAPSTAQAETPISDERQRIQEAITNIRSMGFNYETTLLRELLRRENGDIASVLETILNNTGK